MTSTYRTVSFSIITLILSLALAMSALAAAPEQVAATAMSGQEVVVPAHAAEVAPGLFYLGESYDEDSAQMVEGYMVVHPREGNAKPTGVGGKPDKGGTGDTTTASCFGYLAKGAVWKTHENWLVDPYTNNTYGIASTTILDLLAGGIAKWEDAADGVVDGSGVDVFGTGAVQAGVLADTTRTDGKNEVQFGNLEAGTIAVTIVWGRFGGPVNKRELVEWDQIYNTDYNWSAEADGVAGKYDFSSIATHELGHAFGLDDLYDQKCSAMTMYGYGTTGDISARSLEDGDIAGIDGLY